MSDSTRKVQAHRPLLRRGQRAIYRRFHCNPLHVVVVGFGYECGELVYDCRTADGRVFWGYASQFTPL